jgi:aminopeptidase
MDTDDPIAAWRERVAIPISSAATLTERRFDTLHFRGEGTDLTVGLLPSSRWLAAQFETVDGIVHMPNLPSEEVFTTPDPERTEGVVTSTKPLVVGGSIISGLRVEFAGGRATRIEADENVEVLRAYASRDEGASRLGEVALVDREGRIGPLNTVFFDTLLDENAASHVALGSAYTFAVDGDDVERANKSSIHVDFMIGTEQMEVDATTRDGERVPVLRAGSWQI